MVYQHRHPLWKRFFMHPTVRYGIPFVGSLVAATFVLGEVEREIIEKKDWKNKSRLITDAEQPEKFKKSVTLNINDELKKMETAWSKDFENVPIERPKEE
mmetsp:Transcript_47031/g.121491  ORF Transcript_47031/g.121491 Transcript_47031/m.121491 type:complete len:100 (-) Transcript_47031:2176-2475(-)